MAPTICLAELSMRNNNNSNNNSNSYNIKRRQNKRNSNVAYNSNIVGKNHNSMIKEQHRIELKRMLNNTINAECVVALSPPASPVWEPESYPANSFLLSTRNSTTSVINLNNNCSNESWRTVLARREGLLDIVARTMALVRRSHMLQKRVNALRYETREFIRSVLNNPENNNAGRQRFVELKTQSTVSTDCGCIDTVVSSSSSFSFNQISLSRPITPPPTPDSSTATECNVVNDDYDDNEDTKNERNRDVYNSILYTKTSSSCGYSSDDSEHNNNNNNIRKVTQDPMVSSS